MPHSTYLPERMGSATVSPRGRFEAGSVQEFTLVYTATGALIGYAAQQFGEVDADGVVDL